MPDIKASTYALPLTELMASAHVPVDGLVEEQPEVVVPSSDRYVAEATGMGMPQPTGG